MRLKELLTARYMANRKTTKYQTSIISFCGKAIQKEKIPKNLYWQSYISKS